MPKIQILITKPSKVAQRLNKIIGKDRQEGTRPESFPPHQRTKKKGIPDKTSQPETANPPFPSSLESLG